MMVAGQHHSVARSGPRVPVVDADDVKVLVTTVAGHPSEIGEQHPVAVVNVVEVGLVVATSQNAQRVLGNCAVNACSVVDDAELYVVFLCE